MVAATCARHAPRPLCLFPTIQHQLPPPLLLGACPRPSCRCQEAIDAFSRLPAHHYQTGWVLCCVGRAFFEMVDYPEAAKAFSWARQVWRWGRLGRWAGGAGRWGWHCGLGAAAAAAKAQPGDGRSRPCSDVWLLPRPLNTRLPARPADLSPGGPVPPAGPGGVQHGAVALQARGGAGLSGAGGIRPGPPVALRLVCAGQLLLPTKGEPMVARGGWNGAMAAGQRSSSAGTSHSAGPCGRRF